MIEDFIEWFLGKVIPGTLILIIITGFLFAIIGLPCLLIFGSKTPEIPSGIIVEKNHSSASVIYIKSGSVMIPITAPESWSFVIYNDGKTKTMSTTEDVYSKIKIGSKYGQ